MFAYYPSTFGENAKRSGYILLETALTESTTLPFVCFILTAEYGTSDLFLPARFWALAEDGRACANEVMLAPLPHEKKASILKREPVGIISICEVDPVAATLAFARAGKIDRTAPDCYGALLFAFTNATIIFVPER